MAATVLVFEALVVFFASLVAKDLSGLTTAQAVGGGAVLALVLVLATGALGRPGGYWLGSVLQGAVVATGVVVPMMIGIGLLFTALWVAAVLIGNRIERERSLSTPPGDG
jgi:protein-S-isoprenylcysteine O-methyltransferase Ste14